MHFLAALGYLLGVLLLVYGYILFFHVTYRLMIYLFGRVEYYRRVKKEKLEEPLFTREGFQEVFANFFLLRNRKFWFYFLALNLLGYAYHRFEWTDVSKHAYLDAKEYFAVGLLLQNYQNAFTIITRSPNSTIATPMRVLQRCITKSGTALIPEKDGERDMWTYWFEIYPYIKNGMDLPKAKEVDGIRYVDPVIVENMNATWRIMQSFMTNTMADKEFEEKVKYLAMAPLAIWYQHGYIHGTYDLKIHFATRDMFRNDDENNEELARLKQIVTWLIELENIWPKFPEIQEYLQSNPKLEMGRLHALLLILKDISAHSIWNGRFSCDDEYFNLYFKYRAYFHSAESPIRFVKGRERERYELMDNYYGDEIHTIGVDLCRFKRFEGGGYLPNLKRNTSANTAFQLYFRAQETLKHGNELSALQR